MNHGDKLKAKYGDDYFKELNRKSHEAWEKGGRKPRGSATLSKEKRIEIAKAGAQARWGNREKTDSKTTKEES